MLIRRAFIVMLVVVLAGCGFHLRGTGSYGVSLEAVHIAATNTYGKLQRDVEKLFSQSGVTITGAEAAPYVVNLLSERTVRRPIATGGAGSSAEYELRLEVEFEMADAAGEEVIPLTLLAVERVYRFDTNSFVGSSQEEELLEEEMRRDLAGQLLRRIDATVRANESSAG